ncbi:hypothetical protein D7S74_08205 [Ralstonia pickettii]|nr:hypothetical protein [Ralstonia pickettii]
MLTFFGKTKKVSRPRQGTKGRQTTNTKTKTASHKTHQSAGVMSIWQCDECECECEASAL